MPRAIGKRRALIIANRARLQPKAIYKMTPTPILSVVMPVYNERTTIEEIIRRVTDVDVDKEIIIVDDFSTDGTRDYLASLAERSSCSESVKINGRKTLKVFFQDRNYGKGAAVRRGFREAIGQIVVIQDADLELDPQEYGNLIEPIQRNVADVVYGSRFLKPNSGFAASPNYWGNKVLTAFSNFFTGLNLTDVWTGYKAFRRDILDELELRENGFAFEPEFTAKIARQDWRVLEVPVSYSCRTHKEGKKISWKDAFRGLACTFFYGSTCLFKARSRAVPYPGVPLNSAHTGLEKIPVPVRSKQP
jgi:glycosyltransferase involved in cell wall biosynthesis